MTDNDTTGTSQEDNHCSLSAPSSPTHVPKPPPRTNNLQPETPTRGSRPLSMAMLSQHNSMDPSPTPVPVNSTTRANYADLKFNNNGGPVPLPRRNTTYAEVRKSNKQQPDSGASKKEPYDLPPPIAHNFSECLPPLPPRNEIDHLAPLPLPPPVDDIDMQFNIARDNTTMPSWNFDTNSGIEDGYLHEINSNPLYTNNIINELGTFPDLNDSLDVTGSSAYEDSSLILAAINRGKQVSSSNNNTTDPSLIVVQQQQQGNTHSGYSSPVFDIANDTSECDKITFVDSRSSTPPINDAYQFPSELDIHPANFSPVPNDRERSKDCMNNFETHNATSTSTQSDLYDEPPMGLLSFPPKPERSTTPPPPLYSNILTETPAPPLSVDRSVSIEPIPRPRTNTTPTHVPNKASAPLPTIRNEPPLPPRNPLRTNGQVMDPPVPPRNPTRVSSSPGPPGGGVVHTPPTQRIHQREQTILNLVQLGYSRSEVVKALAVAQNSADLAKKILESFGSRND